MEKVGMHRKVATSFDKTVEDVTEALKSEGFGVLTQIDVRDTLKKKLDVDFAATRSSARATLRSHIVPSSRTSA